MRTDELIDALAAGLRPAPARLTQQRLGWTALAGGAAALSLVALWLGFRADLPEAVRGTTFWMKAAYATVLAAAGFLALERLARPAGSAWRGLLLAGAAVLLLAAAGTAELLGAPQAARLPMWLGHSWRQCAIYILLLSGPMLVLTLLVVRRLAPTRLGLAGGAAGLLCGGVAATAYGLHCPETAFAFVATWYTLGMALSAALGATLGPWLLRWR